MNVLDLHVRLTRVWLDVLSGCQSGRCLKITLMRLLQSLMVWRQWGLISLVKEWRALQGGSIRLSHVLEAVCR